MMKHSELMQYANAFFMATKLFPTEIAKHIEREMATQPMSRDSVLRVQAYRNVLTAQKANSMAAIADTIVSV